MSWIQYITSYTAALVILGILDALYLSMGGLVRYKNALGDLSRNPLNLPPSVPLYVVAVAGYVYFAIRPAVERNDLLLAIFNSMFLGCLYFSFYELTNLVTIKGWPAWFAITEILWGIFASSFIGVAGFWATKFVY